MAVIEISIMKCPGIQVTGPVVVQREHNKLRYLRLSTGTKRGR